ncbi:MAG: UDP-3-O-(3-hydroxymyristoyl)glucosamine N-acyltransferase [Nitrospirota bacterium]|nr:UDP-3-O-(3-hydroxymyristoyl)glucosamine N-acyltransferase [Nitrospirota bacterium]
MELRKLAELLDAQLNGPGDVDIRGAAGLQDAADGDITFLSDEKYAGAVEQTCASAVIIGRTMKVPDIPSLVVKNPRYAFAQVLAILHAKPYVPGGISGQAFIGKDSLIAPDATIHPFAVISAGARIGKRTIIFSGAFIGEGSVVGDDCVVHSNVSIREGVAIGNRVIIHAGTVIGSDGFGFVTEGGVHHKIPQVGGVLIEDDVELGANCAIDRAALGSTVIKRGTKMDNMVHVAHNVSIGEHCLIAGQVGVAGSASLGSYVVIGGQAGVGDHVTVGDRVMIGGGSGITQDMPSGSVVAGYYAMPLRDWLKVQAVLPKLPELRKRISQLERKIACVEVQPEKE